MNDEILKKLEARLDRRSFLRGSSIGVAALLGVAAASPLVVFAQEPQTDKKKPEEKKDPETDKADDKSEYKPDRVEGQDGKFYDREGVEVRECPQCGHNMYQQGRTWTCENCGYSYIE
jgi:ribosomal protein S27AE